MTEIYKEIITRMEAGKRSELITRYTPQGIRQELVEMTDEAPERAGLTFTEDPEGCTLTERFAPKARLIILGGGHIALPLCEIAGLLDFEIWVYDDRPGFANPARFPKARRVICDDFDNMRERLNFRREDYVAVLTRGHRHDMLCLQILFRHGEIPNYVGMIGSKRRIAMVKAEAAAQIGNLAALDRLYAPIGLPIGSVTPAEIALSILAQMVQVKRLDPVGESVDFALLHWLAAEREERTAIATIVSARGSTPREAGAKMAVTDTGEIRGSLGGGCAEAEVVRQARSLIDQGGYLLMEVDLTGQAEEEGMVCGGSMRVLIESN